MSDQYTRIKCGGSALPQSAPVVGLLFGCFLSDETTKHGSKNNSSKALSAAGTAAAATAAARIQIVDADDIPTDRSETAKIQVSLHHAVFPKHDVVGWYRVADSEEPTLEDLHLTQELKSHHCTPGDEEEGVAATTNQDKPFFFSLLQVRNSDAMNDDAATKKKEEEEEEDEELPLTLYKLQGADNAVLIGVEDWSLETSEAERIAVERVVREKPQQDLKAAWTANKKKTTATSASSISSSGAAKVEDPASVIEEEPLELQPSPYASYMASVSQSLEAMDDRIQILIDFLERMNKGEIPPNFSLMRQIQGLILQLGPLQQQTARGGNSSGSASQQSVADVELLAQLAAVAKTVQSVHSYTEKFRVLQESRGGGAGGGGGREGRRGY